MKKLSKILIITLLAVLGTGLFWISSANAQANLEVQFEDDPLFNEANFLPGDTVTRWVKVTNNTAETQQIGTQAVGVSDPDDLGDVMYVEIKQGATSLYTGTLSEFFDVGEIYLSDLAGNSSNTTYNYSITFDSGAGDEYQGLGLGFDIAVGFFGQESVGTEVPVGGSGGGGGGYFSEGLEIFHETIGGVGSDTVTITWDTNLIATSRVIYSPSSSNPVFDKDTPPNYGYDYSTTEDPAKVIDHTVVISGLSPGTVYFFRCVSHASPDTLSPEYSFTTLGPGEAPITEETPLYSEEEGEVLGASIIRTALPETGSPRGEAAGGVFVNNLKINTINIIIASALILIWILLFLLRRAIKQC